MKYLLGVKFICRNKLLFIKKEGQGRREALLFLSGSLLYHTESYSYIYITPAKVLFDVIHQRIHVSVGEGFLDKTSVILMLY